MNSQVQYPDFVSAIVPTVTSSRGIVPPGGLENMKSQLATDPNWNDGYYYDKPGGIDWIMIQNRMNTLTLYVPRLYFGRSVRWLMAASIDMGSTRRWRSGWDPRRLLKQPCMYKRKHGPRNLMAIVRLEISISSFFVEHS